MSDPQVPLQETLMALSGQRKKKADDGGTGYAPESPREYGSIAPSHIPEEGTAEDKETKSREWERQVDQPIESEDPISDGIMAADGIGALVRGATLSKIADQMARAKSKSAGARMTDGMGFAPVEMAARSPVDATELMGHDDIRRMLAANEHPGAVSIGPQMAGMSGDDVMSHLGYEPPAAPDFEQRWNDLFEHLDKPKDKSFVPQAPFDRATPTPGDRDVSLGDPASWGESSTQDLLKKLGGQEPTVSARPPAPAMESSFRLDLPADSGLNAHGTAKYDSIDWLGERRAQPGEEDTIHIHRPGDKEFSRETPYDREKWAHANRNNAETQSGIPPPSHIPLSVSESAESELGLVPGHEPTIPGMRPSMASPGYGDRNDWRRAIGKLGRGENTPVPKKKR